MEKYDINEVSSDRQGILQEWLDTHGLTRRSLSRWIGIDPSLLTLMLQGKRNCTPVTRKHLESVGFPMEVLPEQTSRKPRATTN